MLFSILIHIYARQHYPRIFKEAFNGIWLNDTLCLKAFLSSCEPLLVLYRPGGCTDKVTHTLRLMHLPHLSTHAYTLLKIALSEYSVELAVSIFIL